MILLQSSGPVADLCWELLKLPNLVEHYKERAADSEIGFLDFVDAHYGDQRDWTQHQDRHDGELPFQGSHSCFHGITFMESVNLDLDNIEVGEDKKKISFYRSSFSSSALDDIFQPPQV